MAERPCNAPAGDDRAADESVVAALMDWWFNQPVEDEGTDLDCALDDVKAMLAHLDARGFKVVAK